MSETTGEDSGTRGWLLDAAYWRKGCSSPGLLPVGVLVTIDTGKAERNCR